MQAIINRKTVVLGALGALWSATLLLGGCGTLPGANAGASDTHEAVVRARTIHVQATELDARRNISQDAFPQATVDAFPQYFGAGDDPFARAGAPGYYLYMTSEEQWRIGSYLFVPQEVIVYQGERITMKIFGVRGSGHHTVLMDPDGEQVRDPSGKPIEFNVRRGQLKVIEFIAEHRGLYRLVCCDHQPTMTLNIHVLPQ